MTGITHSNLVVKDPQGQAPMLGKWPISLLDSLGEEKLLHLLLASGLTEGSVDIHQWLGVLLPYTV